MFRDASGISGSEPQWTPTPKTAREVEVEIMLNFQDKKHGWPLVVQNPEENNSSSSKDNWQQRLWVKTQGIFCWRFLWVRNGTGVFTWQHMIFGMQTFSAPALAFLRTRRTGLAWEWSGKSRNKGAKANIFEGWGMKNFSCRKRFFLLSPLVNHQNPWKLTKVSINSGSFRLVEVYQAGFGKRSKQKSFAFDFPQHRPMQLLLPSPRAWFWDVGLCANVLCQRAPPRCDQEGWSLPKRSNLDKGYREDKSQKNNKISIFWENIFGIVFLNLSCYQAPIQLEKVRGLWKKGLLHHFKTSGRTHISFHWTHSPTSDS